MSKSKIIGLDAFLSTTKKDLMDFWVKEQSKRLVEYAEDKIKVLGLSIESYPSGKHMNDKGNLLDSLCWGVCYDGKMVQSGFYRNKKAFEDSELHKWSKVTFKGTRKDQFKDKWIEDVSASEPINGHQLAAEYISQAHKKCKSGEWMVFFAILAPYWGYWEKGFTQVHGAGFINGKGFGSASFQQFAVMSQFYDIVKSNLKRARTRIKVYVPKYTSKSLKSRAEKDFYG